MRWATAAAICVALTAVAAPAAPRMIPARDVDVLYDAAVGTETLTQRMRWNATIRRLRVDPPDPDIHMITDYVAHRVLMVSDGRREVLESDAPAARLDNADPAGFSRVGEDTVAGLGCVDWATRDDEGQASVVCVTVDGVLLRVRRDGRTALVARTVVFAAQDPAVFAVPADYRRRGGKVPEKT